jgi:hypothetical protein
LVDDAGAVSNWSAAGSARSSSEVAVLVTSIAGSDVAVHALTHAELVGAATTAATDLDVSSSSDLLLQRFLADPEEQLLSVALPAVTGAVVSIGEGGVLGSSEAAQVQPTHVLPSRTWLAGITADVARRSTSTSGLKRLLLGRGLVATDPPSTVVPPSRFATTRVVGVLTAVVAFVFLLVSPLMNDWLRLVIVGLIVTVGGVVVARVPGGLAAPIRRRYGLGRTRAVIAQRGDLDPSVLGLLGSLGVSVVGPNLPSGTAVGRVPSEVLNRRLTSSAAGSGAPTSSGAAS